MSSIISDGKRPGGKNRTGHLDAHDGRYTDGFDPRQQPEARRGRRTIPMMMVTAVTEKTVSNSLRNGSNEADADGRHGRSPSAELVFPGDRDDRRNWSTSRYDPAGGDVLKASDCELVSSCYPSDDTAAATPADQRLSWNPAVGAGVGSHETELRRGLSDAESTQNPTIRCRSR